MRSSTTAWRAAITAARWRSPPRSASTTCERARLVDDRFRDIQAFVELGARTAHGARSRSGAGGEGQGDLRAQLRRLPRNVRRHATTRTTPIPNLLIPLDVVGTDPAVADAGVVNAPQLVDWYNGSFYGGITPLVPNDPFPGYMPPPLGRHLGDGAVSPQRLGADRRAGAQQPRAGRCAGGGSISTAATSTRDALGWPWTPVDVPQDQVPDEERKYVYDTTYWSQSNSGHPFGDHLTSPNGARSSST